MREYVNASGFVTVAPNAPDVPGEGNGFLQTGLAYACGMYINSDYAQLIYRCQFGPLDPRIWRSPYKKNPGDETQIDDYWGALILSSSWAEELLDFVEKNGMWFDPFTLTKSEIPHVYCVKQARLKYWFGRFLAFKPFIRFCAYQSTWIDHLVLALTILVDSLFISSASGNMKAFCRVAFTRRLSTPCRLASRFWVWRIKRRYGTVGKSWAEYFGEGHPLNEYIE